MTSDAIRQIVLDTIQRLAPGTDIGRIRPDRPLRSQLDLDSMDWLNVIAGLQEQLGLRIPESDFGQIQTLEHLTAYCLARLQDTLHE